MTRVKILKTGRRELRRRQREESHKQLEEVGMKEHLLVLIAAGAEQAPAL